MDRVDFSIHIMIDKLNDKVLLEEIVDKEHISISKNVNETNKWISILKGNIGLLEF